MQTEHLVADSHLLCRKVYVLQTGNILHRERHIFLNKTGRLFCTDKFIIGKTAQPDIAGIVDDTLELLNRLHELDNHLVIEFLRGYPASAERRKVALLTRPFLRGLCQEQITLVGEIRTLVEMTLKAPVQKG
ncbi:hypothetical protein IMSAGC004_00459 [Bacteroidaceae bacterium]|nr:hypothetical protein IMSAGC004_00459 [Bacteroidaceae bacterium]GFI57316.1 hypothetical protein IMSAG025_00755 [Muribaculaceae bacterium]